MTNKSIAISPFTMPAALAAADSLLENPTWSAPSDESAQSAQARQWLEHFRRRAGIAQEMPEVHRNATTDVADHVSWLKTEGWDAQVTQGDPNDIFLAATINIVAKWQEAGRAYKGRDGVNRVFLKKGASVAHSPVARPIVTVMTQNPGFYFLFQQLEHEPASLEELAVRALDASLRRVNGPAQLDFPMTDLCVRDDARYMIGLRSGLNVVTQAAEQLRLELNEIGGRASEAAEVAVTRGMSMGPETVYIDGPFMVAVIRANVPCDSDRIAFAAYVDKDSWKKPADGRI